MDSLCVFCGATPGADPIFSKAASEFGKLIANAHLTLVYGGGRRGLMGVMADAALAAGGRVIGVMPQALVDKKEVAHPGLSELRIVHSMHQRKAVMAELSEGFVALPGGIGTLEEFFEVWTWGQLGLHAKPYGLLNVAGFYDPLLELIDRLVQQEFIRDEHRTMLLVEREAERLLQRMSTHRPVFVAKWIEDDET